MIDQGRIPRKMPSGRRPSDLCLYSLRVQAVKIPSREEGGPTKKGARGALKFPSHTWAKLGLDKHPLLPDLGSHALKLQLICAFVQDQTHDFHLGSHSCRNFALKSLT